MSTEDHAEWTTVSVSISKDLYDKLQAASKDMCIPTVENKIRNILLGWEQNRENRLTS